ncbi:MAG: nickel-dependent lactate racemase [Deltaproteobacteria bacterium]|nr:nickel-dependent lactate racemase [Deltaproteobacteria bacterium]
MRLEYGKTGLDLPIPEKEVAGNVLKPKEIKSLGDIEKRVEETLRQPIDSPPLDEVLRGKKTALMLTVNHTRPSPSRLIRPILRVCEQLGVKVTICIASGRHRQMSPEEIDVHLGRDLTRRYPVVHHDPFDQGAHVEIGSTSRGTPVIVNRIIFEHDCIMGAGIIEPSYLCGFTGGRKILMPGVAFHRAIDWNHYFLLEKGARAGVLDGNPLSEDAEEFARKLPFHWITYAVAGAEDQFVEIVSGNPYAAHRIGCDISKKIYSVPLRQADIVVSSPGGYPYDMDLVQGKKAVVPAQETVKPGGVIILTSECEEGWGAEPTFEEWVKGYSPQEVVQKVRDRSQFTLGAHGANILAKPIVEKEVMLIVVTNPKMAGDLKGTYVQAVTDLREALEMAQEKIGKRPSFLVLRKSRRLIVEK